MADAKFWRDLVTRFRALPADDGKFRIDWSAVVGRPGTRWTLIASENTRVQFELLARRAGLALEPESKDFLLVWLNLLKDSSASRPIRNEITLSADDTSSETAYGSIENPCGASAVRCSVLEADALKRKRGKTVYAPNDTRALLPPDALKQIDRAHIEAERFTWEAEVSIEVQHLSNYGAAAKAERNQGRLRKARHTLTVLQSEYSRLGLSDSEYRICINGEVEAASNSLELYDSQRRLLENEFFFQIKAPAEPETAAHVESEHTPKPSESIPDQLNRLRVECRWTIETLAEHVDFDQRSVERHLSGKVTPRLAHVGSYERAFSEALDRKVVICRTPVKRR